MQRTVKTGLALAKAIQRDLFYLQSAKDSNWPRATIRSIIRSFRGKYKRGTCTIEHSRALGR